MADHFPLPRNVQIMYKKGRRKNMVWLSWNLAKEVKGAAIILLRPHRPCEPPPFPEEKRPWCSQLDTVGGLASGVKCERCQSSPVSEEPGNASVHAEAKPNCK